MDEATRQIEAMRRLERYRDAVGLTELQHGVLWRLRDGPLADLSDAIARATDERRMLALAEIESVAALDDYQRYAWLFGVAPDLCWFSVAEEVRAGLVRAAIERGSPVTEAERDETLRSIREHPERVY
jgi:hypothetical protein